MKFPRIKHQIFVYKCNYDVHVHFCKCNYYMQIPLGGKPKKENALKTIVLMLGPDFMTDHITVSTCI